LCRFLCPEHVNPAEFLADLISVDYSSSETVYSSQKRVHALVDAFSQRSSSVLYATPLGMKGETKNGMRLRRKAIVERKDGWWRQFFLLLKRAWMQVSSYALSEELFL